MQSVCWVEPNSGHNSAALEVGGTVSRTAVYIIYKQDGGGGQVGGDDGLTHGAVVAWNTHSQLQQFLKHARLTQPLAHWLDDLRPGAPLEGEQEENRKAGGHPGAVVAGAVWSGAGSPQSILGAGWSVCNHAAPLPHCRPYRGSAGINPALQALQYPHSTSPVSPSSFLPHPFRKVWPPADLHHS